MTRVCLAAAAIVVAILIHNSTSDNSALSPANTVAANSPKTLKSTFITVAPARKARSATPKGRSFLAPLNPKRQPNKAKPTYKGQEPKSTPDPGSWTPKKNDIQQPGHVALKGLKPKRTVTPKRRGQKPQKREKGQKPQKKKKRNVTPKPGNGRPSPSVTKKPDMQDHHIHKNDTGCNIQISLSNHVYIDRIPVSDSTHHPSPAGTPPPIYSREKEERNVSNHGYIHESTSTPQPLPPREKEERNVSMTN